jgi:hAT family C-terminal dimerisation region
VAHWWNQENVLRTGLIALPKLLGDHKGANIAYVLVQVFEQYNIMLNVGYFMLDNASNNDTAIESVHDELAAHGIDRVISSLEGRLRCVGHIINLVAKALLFGKDTDALEMDEVDFATWRKVGAVGKLHNIIRWIRASPQRRDRFLEIQINILANTKAFMLRQNNETRWNSTFDMIERALELRTAIDTFIVASINDRSIQYQNKQKSDTVALDKLSSTDWKELEEMCELLRPFKYITKDMEGNIGDSRMNGAICDVLPAMDFLLQHLEEAKKKYVSTKSTLSTCINLAWKKLDEYYTLTDSTPVYACAVILDPRLKLHYFQRRWREHPRWIAKAKGKIEVMYFKYQDEMKATQSDANLTPTSSGYSDAKVSALTTWKFEENVPLATSQDELEDYLTSPRERSTIVPTVWWIAQESRFPVLSKIARDILSIPAMSSEVERVFSGYYFLY